MTLHDNVTHNSGEENSPQNTPLNFMLQERSQVNFELTPLEVHMSSQYSPSHPATNCIDGSTEGDLCITKIDIAPWLAIQLDRKSSVHSVVIYSGAKKCDGPCESNTQIRVTNELPNTDASMYVGGNLMGSFPEPENNDVITITGVTPEIGQFVLIQRYSRGQGRLLSLCEVKVFGSLSESSVPTVTVTSETEPSEITTVSGKSPPTDSEFELTPVGAFTSGQDFTDIPASICIDGDTLGRFCTTGYTVAPWLAIQLQDASSVHSVTIYSSTINDLFNLTVQITNDLPMSDDKMHTGGLLLGSFLGFSSPEINITGKTPQSGKFVVIQKYSNGFDNFLYFCEVKVFGNHPQSPQGENTSEATEITETKETSDKVKLIIGAVAGSILFLILVSFCAVYVFKHHRASVDAGDQDDDDNPEYGLYTIHDDPVAEVVDTCEDYAMVEDPGMEDATRVGDRNSNYSSDN